MAVPDLRQADGQHERLLRAPRQCLLLPLHLLRVLGLKLMAESNTCTKCGVDFGYPDGLAIHNELGCDGEYCWFCHDKDGLRYYPECHRVAD